MTISPHALVFRAALVCCALIVVLIAPLTSGASPTAGSWVVGAAALACAVGAAAYPDGQVVGVSIALLLANWLMVVENELSALTPVAACCLVVMHLCASIASLTPLGTHLGSASYRRWATRATVLCGIAIALWLGAFIADDVEPASGIVVVLGLGVLLGGGVWLVRARVLAD